VAIAAGGERASVGVPQPVYLRVGDVEREFAETVGATCNDDLVSVA